jgi:hypothetical protein
MEEFCRRWLEAWSGNRPGELLGFYAEDVFYADPAVRDGLHGINELSPYLQRLLAANPNWRWEMVELMPTEKGFTLKWQAVIPAGEQVVQEEGLDIVEIKDGKISRNEVFFDRTQLLAAMKER